MAFPMCPACGLDDMAVKDRAADIKPSEPGSPVLHTIAVYRSYECPCGWTYWTTEVVTVFRPKTTRLRRKFGAQANEREPSASHARRGSRALPR